MTEGPAPSPSGLEPGSLASFLDFLWRHRFPIVGITGIATLIAVVAVLVAPVEYTARAVVLPQDRQESSLISTAMSLLGGSISNLPLSSLGGLGGETDVEVPIIRSERLADAMNDRFHLSERYKTSRRHSRLRQWYARLGTKKNPQGLLTVTYRDRDPEFASQVVSGVIEEMERISAEIRSTAGKRSREFLERRVAKTRDRLSAMEDSLAAYQTEHGGAALSSGTVGAVEAGADLLTQRVRMETDTEILRRTLGSDAPALRAKELEIAALDRQLDELPALGSELARMTRDLKVLERTYGYLSAQLEDARLKEARDVPRVQILDPPVPPTEKSRPQRTITVLIVFFVSGLIALLTGLLLDAGRRVREARSA